MKRLLTILLIIVFAVSVLLIGSGCSQQTVETTAAETTAAETIAAETTVTETTVAEEPSINLEDYYTKGPNGEEAVPADQLSLTEEEKQQVRDGNYKAAYLTHTSGEFTNALLLGAQDLFDDLNIELAIVTDAEYDSVKQQADVETAMAIDPDIILTLVIDSVSAAAAFQPAVDAGVQLVLLSNPIEGYVAGKDYVAIVTDDLFGMGKAAAEILADAMGEQGKIGWIFHDAGYYVTNQRDNAFKAVIQANYPNMEIIAEAGLANPADAETIAAAMVTRYPEIGGIYVTWDQPAEGVVAACRAAERPDIKVVTLDLGASNSLDMAKGGNIVGTAADLAYQLGYTKALVGAYGLLGKEAPPFIIVPAIKVTKDNLVEGWNQSLNIDPPQVVLDALGQ